MKLLARNSNGAMHQSLWWECACKSDNCFQSAIFIEVALWKDSTFQAQFHIQVYQISWKVLYVINIRRIEVSSVS